MLPTSTFRRNTLTQTGVRNWLPVSTALPHSVRRSFSFSARIRARGALTIIPVVALHTIAGGIANSEERRPRMNAMRKRDDRQRTKSRILMTERKSQDDLVDYLAFRNVISTQRVKSAMRSVDRKQFINPQRAKGLEAYEDNPLPLGWGQTISAPHMHGVCLELMETVLQPGARALDVGSGSGYLTACMAQLVGPEGFVLGVEKVPEIMLMSIQNIKASHPTLLDSGRVRIINDNALTDVLEMEEPFHAIHVGAAADEIPDVLLRKLAPGGRMVIPVGPRWGAQVLTVVDKDASGKIHQQQRMGVGYVPLMRPSEMEDGYMHPEDEMWR